MDMKLSTYLRDGIYLLFFRQHIYSLISPKHVDSFIFDQSMHYFISLLYSNKNCFIFI